MVEHHYHPVRHFTSSTTASALVAFQVPTIGLWRTNSCDLNIRHEKNSQSRTYPFNISKGRIHRSSFFNFDFNFQPPFSHQLPQTFPSIMSSVLPPSLAPRVLVTGATGFAATALIDHLLRLNYVVHATYRPQSKPKLPPDSNRLFLFEADLVSDKASQAFQRAAEGCNFAVHLASPMCGDTANPVENLIKPAVDGTLAFLNACKAASVKRVVVVSSHMAIAQGGQRKGRKQRVFTEDDWNNESSIDHLPLYYSKTKAEQVVWDFMKREEANKPVTTDQSDTMNNSKQNMEVVVVNPAFMWGRAIEKQEPLENPLEHNESIRSPSPSANSNLTAETELPTSGEKEEDHENPVGTSVKELNVSKEVLLQLCRGALPGIFDLAMPVVHVRDVAKVVAHLLQSPTAKGRYIVCPSDELVHVRDMVKTIHEMGHPKPSKKELTNPALTRFLRVVSHIQPGGVTGQYLRVILANPVRLSNERIKKEMGAGFQFTDVTSVLRETITEIFDDGHIDSQANVKLVLNLEK